MNTLTDSKSIDAEIKRLQTEQTDVSRQLETLAIATADTDGIPTRDQAIEHSTLQLRLAALPPMIAKLVAQHKEVKIAELKAALEASEPAWAAVVEDYKAVNREQLQMRHILDIWKTLQVWLLYHYLAPMTEQAEKRLKIMKQLLELDAMSSDDIDLSERKLGEIRTYAGDATDKAWTAEFAIVEQKVADIFGLEVPQDVKARWAGWGRPFRAESETPEQEAARRKLAQEQFEAHVHANSTSYSSQYEGRR